MARVTLPSPQKAMRWQAAPAVGHVYPASTAHAALQPSFATVLPSSHCSLPATVASPHTLAGALVHGPPLPDAVGHVYPGSTKEQSALQPSPAAVLPSSQASPGSMRALPQTQIFAQGWPAAGHA